MARASTRASASISLAIFLPSLTASTSLARRSASISFRQISQDSSGSSPFFFSSDAELDYWDVAFPERTVLVFGRESVGLPEEIRHRYADRVLRLPMADPELRSLNLANTVTAAVYEVLRQRN